MEERFIDLFRSINRDNTTKLLVELKRLGFFEAPASANFHLNKTGGLLEHSLAVYDCAMQLKETLKRCDEEWDGLETLKDDSILVSALLHDVCKAGIYVPTTKRQRQPDGTWIDVEGYAVDYSEFPMGHGEKSMAIVLRCGYPLSNEEMLAIRWHMYAFGVNFNNYEELNNFNTANKIPLVKLIQLADQMATVLNK